MKWRRVALNRIECGDWTILRSCKRYLLWHGHTASGQMAELVGAYDSAEGAKAHAGTEGETARVGQVSGTEAKGVMGGGAAREALLALRRTL